MDQTSAREGELRLGRNAQATWRAGVVAGVIGGSLVPMWILVFDRLLPLHWGLFPPSNYRKTFYVMLLAAAVACVVSQWVARTRQPRGARISWDAWGITEWDGDGARVAIPWREATVGVRCDFGGGVALMVLRRRHLAGFAGSDQDNVIGLTLRIQGAHGRQIWVTEGVQTPALAGRLTTVDDLGPLLKAIEGVRLVPMEGGHPGENLLALFYMIAIAGYVCAVLGLGNLLSVHTVPTYVPHFLLGSAFALALRALLPCLQYLRLAAEERRLRTSKPVTLIDNDGPQLTARDDAGTAYVVDTGALAHPDGRLHERRGAAFLVADAAGRATAVETAAARAARRTYQRAIGTELALRATLVLPVLATMGLFHARYTASKPWTVLDGPYSSHDTSGALLDDGSHALIATHTSPGHDLSLLALSATTATEIAGLDLGLNNLTRALALAPDRSRAVISRGTETHVWTVAERHARPQGSLAGARGVVAAVFSRDGDLLLTGDRHGAVSLWRTADFERLHTFTAHTGEVLALTFSDDGARAVSGGADSTARLLDLKTGTQGAALDGHEERVQAVAFLHETIVTGAADGAVRFFSADGALERAVHAHEDGVTAIGHRADGALATAGGDHRIRRWDPDWRREGSEDVAVINMHTDEEVRGAGRITAVAFAPAEDALLAITSHGMLLRVELAPDGPEALPQRSCATLRPRPAGRRVPPAGPGYDDSVRSRDFAFLLPLAAALGCGDDTVDDGTAADTSTSTGDPTGAPTSGSTAPTGGAETTGDTGEPVGCVVLVDGAAGDDASSGSTWLSAKQTITAGLDEAEARATGGLGPCEVWVAAGTYRPLDIDASFVLRPGIGLYGGFAGGESTRDERDWAAHETILSGELGDEADLEDNARHVVLGADGAVLDGFTVTGGYARGDDMQRNGGGILHTAGHLTVAHCVIAGNRTGRAPDGPIGPVGNSAGNGAGVFVTAASLTLLDSLVDDNHGGVGGEGSDVGGVGGEGPGVAFIDGVDLTVRRVQFTANHAGDGGPGGDVGGPGGSGAGLMVARATGAVVIDACDFDANVSGSGGPSANLAGPGGGSALFLTAAAGETVVARALFRDNLAGARGSVGGLGFFGNIGGAGGLTLVDSRFIGNTAEFAGGLAVFVDAEVPAAPVRVVNVTVVDNVSTGSAAGFALRTNGQRELTIAGVTVAGNATMYGGGGVWFQTQEKKGSGRARLVNSIVWGNTAMTDPNLFSQVIFTPPEVIPLEIDATAVEGGCVPGQAIACGSLLPGPPGFVDLAAGDVHLAAGSSLVDAGDDALTPPDVADLDADGDLAEPTPLDLDGLPRRVGAAIDPGAYERP